MPILHLHTPIDDHREFLSYLLLKYMPVFGWLTVNQQKFEQQRRLSTGSRRLLLMIRYAVMLKNDAHVRCGAAGQQSKQKGRRHFQWCCQFFFSSLYFILLLLPDSHPDFNVNLQKSCVRARLTATTTGETDKLTVEILSIFNIHGFAYLRNMRDCLICVSISIDVSAEFA